MKKNKPTISYAIPVCSEHLELEQLLNQLNEVVDAEDQIVVMFDWGNTTPEVKKVVMLFSSGCNCEFTVLGTPLNGDFANFKNTLKSRCTRDYIFQIDADEYLGEGLLHSIKDVLEDNPNIELFYLARINIVRNITDEYIQSQRWTKYDFQFPIAKELNESVINYPDSQARLFKNIDNIRWVKPVHESLVGFKTYTIFAFLPGDYPADEIQKWCLIHVKDFQRQKKQNEFYETIGG